MSRQARFRLYCTPGVILIAASLSLGIIAGSISMANTNDDKEKAVVYDYIRGLTTTASAILLNAFIIHGLWSVVQQSTKLYNEFQSLNPVARQAAEDKYGTKDFSNVLAYVGMILSGIANSALIISTFTNIWNIWTQDTQNTIPLKIEWLSTAFAITNLASLLGFVLFNILGFRNALVLNAKHEYQIEIANEESVLNERSNPVSNSAALSSATVGGASLTSPAEASSLLLAPNIASQNAEDNSDIAESTPSSH